MTLTLSLFIYTRVFQPLVVLKPIAIVVGIPDHVKTTEKMHIPTNTETQDVKTK